MTQETLAGRKPGIDDHVLVEQAAGVLTLTLNRPERKNALIAALARAAAEAVAAQPPAAVAITKRLMRDGEALAARIAEENRHFAAQLKSPEAREAFAAFREKRRPDFSKVR